MREDPATHDLLVETDRMADGVKKEERVDLLVLATGMVPQTDGLPSGFPLDEFRFVAPSEGATGLQAAGCVHRPGEVSATVQDATGAALKALQAVVRSARHA